CESSSTNVTFEKATAAVNEIFKGLRDVTRARTHMKQFNSASYKPLMKQVVEEIYNPDRPDPVDIEHMSSGLTDLLKTGFSMFMKLNLALTLVAFKLFAFGDQKKSL
ncbi:Sec1 family domain-containing protein 2, partial [Ophiophagus hannah]